MNWYPNVEAILFLLREIWPLVRAKRPEATLDIVGAGAPDAITELAANSPGVTLYGYVPDFRPLIDSAALYVCPIRDGGGTKLKMLDALAMAKCIVAHPIACEGIDVTDGSNCIYAESPLDFADKIDQLLGDETQRAKLGEAARQLAVERYAFGNIGRQLVGVFEDIAG
jgi:glycosyltransferase involved in cell wall biosynthesis